MKVTLRQKFMLWLMLYLAVIYVSVGFGLFLFNRYELRTHPDEIEEEKKELLIIYGIMLAALPIAIGGAWIVTGKALRPIMEMLIVADDIGSGKLKERLEPTVENDELGHLARTLNSAFDNYQRVLTRVDRFSLDAAHQLRNPLAAMRTEAEVCLQRTRSSEEYSEAIAKMLNESRRLGHTVDQLLLLARLTWKIPVEKFETLDLETLVGELAENLRPVFEDQGIHLEVALPNSRTRVRGLPNLLEQALENLLDNALRITPPQGRVQVNLKAVGNGQVSLTISDSGPGLGNVIAPGPLNPEQPAYIAHSGNGAGLGLLIVSNIIHAHSGTVEVNVSEWNGAKFTVSLPVLDDVKTEV